MILRTGLVGLVLIVIAVCVVSYVRSQRRAKEASPVARASHTPAKSEPQYVDDARCASCHDDIYATYRAHPMGRSMHPVTDSGSDVVGLAEDEGAFTVGVLRYEVLRRNGHLFHSETHLDAGGEPLATTMLPVAYAVGSAERGRSYLVNRDGRLFMSPITWYSTTGRRDLSPGYEDRNSHFNRPVVVQCVFCHANRSHPVAGSLATYEEPIFTGHAIGCQRCHGPGEDHIALHSASASAGNLAETIVNPARLAPKLREAVCQQCHLSGAAKVLRRGKTHYDFRPGMPLEEVLRVFVNSHEDGETARFVGHVEQMHASRCFQASDGRMGCTSCHDPHQKPAADARIDYFRTRCLTCHEQSGCTESTDVRQATDDNCIQCHMPSRGTEIRHAAISDHRILRRPGDESVAADADVAVHSERALLPFHAPAEGDLDLPRDAALALLRAEDSEEIPLDELRLRNAARDLQDAVELHPDDLAAWEGLGMATWRAGDLPTALGCFESVISRDPNREFSLVNAASIYTSLRRPDRALGYWQQALAINPWIVRYRAESAAALANIGRWADCETTCRETLQHFPDSHRSRQLLVESLLGQRRFDEANREFEAWLRFRPGDPAALRGWFENHPRQRRESARDGAE
jgi:Flp pilus assembly protein TadD